MQPRRVNPGRGLRWLIESAEITGRHIQPLAGVAVVWVLISLIGFLPVIGGLVMVLIGPLLSAGLVAAFHFLEQGRRPSPGILFEGWRRTASRGPLLRLGLFVLLGILLALILASILLGSQMSLEAMQALAEAGPQERIRLLQGVNPWPAMLVAFAIMLVVMAGLYLAVPLALINAIGTIRGLRASWNACLANLPAMIVLVLSLFGVGLCAGVILVLVGMIVSIALPENTAAMVMQIPTLILGVIIQVVFAGAQYRAWRDIFGTETEDTGPDGNSDNDRLTV